MRSLKAGGSGANTVAIVYEPGQIHIGAVWNRFGDPSGNLSDDWPRTLAHELGHYAFYLEDDYLGLSANGVLFPVNKDQDLCPGVMSDPYSDKYSEFHPDVDWLPGCRDTLANHTTRRSDWAARSR